MNPDNNLISSQKTKWYHVDSFGPGGIFEPGMYVHMLAEDTANLVLPADSLRQGRFKTLVSPPDERIGNLFDAALGGRHDHLNLSDSVWEFFQQCSYTLLSVGSVFYELVYFSKTEDEQTPVAFKLVPIIPGSIQFQKGSFFQIIPLVVSKKEGFPQRIQIENGRIVWFQLPDNVRRRHKEIIDTLGICGSHLLPILQMRKRGDGFPYDSEKHRRTQMLSIAGITRLIGWNARRLLYDDMTEWYWLYRELLFIRFSIELRQSILGVVNSAFCRAGQIMKFEGQLQIEGLPTLQDVDRALNKMNEGKCTFAEIMEPFKV